MRYSGSPLLTCQNRRCQNMRCSDMRWLWLVGSIKIQVSWAKEPYQRGYILQKRPIILSILPTVATPCLSQKVTTQLMFWYLDIRICHDQNMSWSEHLMRQLLRSDIDTGWRGVMGCLICICHFQQKSPIEHVMFRTSHETYCYGLT